MISHPNDLHFTLNPRRSSAPLTLRPGFFKLTMSSLVASARPYFIQIIPQGRNLPRYRAEQLCSATATRPENVHMCLFAADTNEANSTSYGHNRILIVDGEGIQCATADTLVSEARHAISNTISCGVRICSDKWLVRFSAKGWTEKGLIGEDLTDTCGRLVGLSSC